MLDLSHHVGIRSDMFKLSNYVGICHTMFESLPLVDDRSIGLPMLRPMVPSVFSKPSADGFYFKNHRFSEKMAEKDHLGNILRKQKK